MGDEIISILGLDEFSLPNKILKCKINSKKINL